MKSQLFFSVIMPTYNRRSFLKKAIDSVLGQSCGDFELIIYDDGSTDGTDKMISEYTDARLFYLSGANRGVAYARNRALERTRGRYIAFLDSDDWWMENKLEKTLEHINRYPEISIFHTEEVWYRNSKLLKQLPKHRKPDGWVFQKALPLCCISISTAVVKREVFDDIGLFDESLEACEDYDFWLRTTSKYEVRLIPDPLTLKDGGRPDQLSSRVWGLDRFRIRALEKMLSDRTLRPEYRTSTLAEIRKKCEVFARGALKRGNHDTARRYLSLPSQYSRIKSGG